MGNQGVSGRGNEPSGFYSSIVLKGTHCSSSISKQLTQVRYNDNLLNRQAWQGYSVSHPGVTLQTYTARI